MQGWSLFSSLDIWGTIEPFRPIIDDVEYTKQPMDSFRDGDWHTDKGLVIGTNTQELEMIQYYIPFIDISRLMYKVILLIKLKHIAIRPIVLLFHIETSHNFSWRGKGVARIQYVRKLQVREQD